MKRPTHLKCVDKIVELEKSLARMKEETKEASLDCIKELIDVANINEVISRFVKELSKEFSTTDDDLGFFDSTFCANIESMVKRQVTMKIKEDVAVRMIGVK